MNCPYCGAGNRKKRKTCKKCGNELRLPACPKCGNIPGAEDVFCNLCGEPRRPAAPPKQPRRKMLRIAAVLMALAIPVLAGVFIWRYVEKGPFEHEIMTGFDFVDTAADEIVFGGESKPSPSVSGIAPFSGTVGTKIVISGSNFTHTGFQYASLGETNLIVNSIEENAVEIHVPFGSASGEIKLIFAESTVSAGYFDVLPQAKTLLLEKTLAAGAEPQTVEAENIDIVIPGGELSAPQAIRIEQIPNPQPVNLPSSVTGTAFSISIGELRQFSKLLTIVYRLPDNAPGEPSAAYFNEETSLWNTLPSEVVNGRLYIRTDHLTDFFIFYWGKAIYSPDGYFKIYYRADDRAGYGADMNDLAQKTGVALEKARKDYEAKIPAAYRVNFFFAGFKNPIHVYLDSAYDKGDYNALTNNICLPTSYRDETDFETMPAHELFHACQDEVWSEFAALGKMGRAENLWAVEALAELAAYELAFPEKGRQRPVSDGVESMDPYNTFNKVHEYSMSCFLKYLLKKTGSTFEELWIAAAKSNNVLLSTDINQFFQSKSSDFVSLEVSYAKFWRDVLGDAQAPRQETLDSLFYPRTQYFMQDSSRVTLQYQSGQTATVAFGLFTVKRFSDNMPRRIFMMKCLENSQNSIWSTKLNGVRSIADLNSARIPGGYPWDYSYAGGSADDQYKIYDLTKGKDETVVIALDYDIVNNLTGVSISEIQAQCKPEKVSDAVTGKEYEFSFAFKDIFAHVNNMLLKIDYGDGTVKQYRMKNENGMLSGTVKHAFGGLGSKAVECSLFDVTGAKKELISFLSIPFEVSTQVLLSADPIPAEPGNPVRFSVNIENTGYTYKWNFGDGSDVAATQGAATEHLYGKAGTFAASVMIYTNTGELFGSAETTVTVEPPETTAQAETTTQESITPVTETWKHTTQIEDYIMLGTYYYIVETLYLGADGTCRFESKPVEVKAPPPEYAAGGKNHRLNTSSTPPDYEYGEGAYTYDASITDAYDVVVGGGYITLYDFYSPGSNYIESYSLRNNGQELIFYSHIFHR